MERIIYLTHMEETKRVQNLISNDMDTCLDIRRAEYTIDPRRQSQRLYLDRARVAARVSRLVAGVLGI